MPHQFKLPTYPLLVYTDLDGTLLDHDSYSYAAALPALQRLAAHTVPIIPVTSKTLAELRVLIRELDFHGPCIAENGGVIAIPRGYFDNDLKISSQQDEAFDIIYLSPEYKEIVERLHELRDRFQFHFMGFADMQDATVADLTGLNLTEAKHARQRLCSEPLQWQDSDKALAEFRHELEKQDLRLVEGGRFHHVLGATNKALAIKRLEDYYHQAGFEHFTRIALGDSPNDLDMLAAADIAVIVRRKDGSWLSLDGHGQTVATQSIGPEGWNAFFQDYLNRLDSQNKSDRESHG